MENQSKKVSPDEVEKTLSPEGDVDVIINDKEENCKENTDKEENCKKETNKEETESSKVEEKPEVEVASKEDKTSEESETKKVKKEKRSKLKDENIKLKEENKKLNEKYLKAYAEMENSKKRLNQQYVLDRKYSSQSLITNLIDPIDMLKKVCAYEAATEEMKNFLMGFKMISDQLSNILETEGLKEIEAKGKKFDPNLHHAVQKEHVDGVEPDTIIEVQQSGYMYKDRVLRPAMVKVSE